MFHHGDRIQTIESKRTGTVLVADVHTSLVQFDRSGERSYMIRNDQIELIPAKPEPRVIREGSYVAFMRNETETEAGTVFRIVSKPQASYVSIMTDDGHVYVRDVTRVRFVSEVVAGQRKE